MRPGFLRWRFVTKTVLLGSNEIFMPEPAFAAAWRHETTMHGVTKEIQRWHVNCTVRLGCSGCNARCCALTGFLRLGVCDSYPGKAERRPILTCAYCGAEIVINVWFLLLYLDRFQFCCHLYYNWPSLRLMHGFDMAIGAGEYYGDELWYIKQTITVSTAYLSFFALILCWRKPCERWNIIVIDFERVNH